MSNDINYVRKQFPVQAQRVTPLNMNDLAKWCGGEVKHDGDKEGNFTRDYIQVRVANPQKPEHSQAKIGSWIVKSGKTWKVYNDTAFRKTFERKDGSPVETVDAPAVAKKAPVPGPPKQSSQNEFNPTRAAQEEFAREQEAKEAREAKQSTDLGANVETPNDDGSITVTPKQAPPLVGETGPTVVSTPDPVVASAEQTEEEIAAIRNAHAEKITDMTLNGATPEELQAAIEESKEALRPPPTMTEVAPGVEISDGPVRIAADGELVDTPQDVVVESGTPIPGIPQPEVASDPDGLGV